MAKAGATVHGAVSLVNAIANKKGATLPWEFPSLWRQ
jgi:shikimate kinase